MSELTEERIERVKIPVDAIDTNGHSIYPGRIEVGETIGFLVQWYGGRANAMSIDLATSCLRCGDRLRYLYDEGTNSIRVKWRAYGVSRRNV